MRQHPNDADHIATCDDCQARAALHPTALDVDLDGVWIAVAAEAWASPVSPPEKAAARLLGSPGLARALVNTPSLFLSWVLASVAVLAAGVLATFVVQDPIFALIAPALAGAGIAFAYGPGVDPAHELTRTTVVSDSTLLLVRVLAVFGLNAAFGLVASLFTLSAVGLTLGWLVPMTTVSALALAVATLACSANAGVLVALCAWGMTITATAGRARDLEAAVTTAALTPFYAAATVALVALTLYARNAPRRHVIWS